MFVHGARGDHTSWAAQVEAVAPTHRCVTFDLTSHDDLRAVVDHVAPDRVIVVAQSAGGVPAMALARRRPALVSALVLVGSIGTIDDTGLRQRLAEHRGVEDAWPQVARSLDPDDLARPADLPMPVLLVVGADDPLVPVDVVADLARRMPRARHAVIHGAAHRPAEQQPDAFNAELRNFLDHL